MYLVKFLVSGLILMYHASGQDEIGVSRPPLNIVVNTDSAPKPPTNAVMINEPRSIKPPPTIEVDRPPPTIEVKKPPPTIEVKKPPPTIEVERPPNEYSKPGPTPQPSQEQRQNSNARETNNDRVKENNQSDRKGDRPTKTENNNERGERKPGVTSSSIKTQSARRVDILYPPKTVPTPMFSLDSTINLKWDYDKNLKIMPKMISISVQAPKDPKAGPNAKPMLYEFATNISGTIKEFSWNTKKMAPSGFNYRSGKGYFLYIYDSVLGFKKSDVAPTGRLQKFVLPFIFYDSTYTQTNDGVPRDYNPNASNFLKVSKIKKTKTSRASLFIQDIAHWIQETYSNISTRKVFSHTFHGVIKFDHCLKNASFHNKYKTKSEKSSNIKYRDVPGISFLKKISITISSIDPLSETDLINPFIKQIFSLKLTESIGKYAIEKDVPYVSLYKCKNLPEYTTMMYEYLEARSCFYDISNLICE
ncbi:hypothetical protein BB559_000928 [Furculomyces boomerangus]|uniref:DUF7137 domain-containing protein n=1 Tax=Furculomyces boomerangus TaxID=61424 RepID=A0A2T9Z3M0_9FUNG|nr:hypothetical protein BB559_000928 [Furculomyces boomerangus]